MFHDIYGSDQAAASIIVRTAEECMVCGQSHDCCIMIGGANIPYGNHIQAQGQGGRDKTEDRQGRREEEENTCLQQPAIDSHPCSIPHSQSYHLEKKTDMKSGSHTH